MKYILAVLSLIFTMLFSEGEYNIYTDFPFTQEIEYTVYLPCDESEIRPDTKLHCYVRGYDSFNANIYEIIKKADTDSIVVLLDTPILFLTGRPDEIMTIIQGVADEYSLETERFSISGISYGGPVAIEIAAESCKDEYKLKASSVSKINSCMEYTPISMEKLDAYIKILSENDVPLISADPNNNDLRSVMLQNGCTLFELTIKGSNHDRACMELYRKNYIDFLDNAEDMLETDRYFYSFPEGEEQELNYEAFKQELMAAIYAEDNIASAEQDKEAVNKKYISGLIKHEEDGSEPILLRLFYLLSATSMT